MLKTHSFKLSALSILIKPAIDKAPLALLAFALLSGLSCGKRRAPLPPIERVTQRVEASAFQRGSRVILSWKMPARNAPDGSVLNISRADVYRLAEPLDSPLTLSEEEFASRSVVVATIPIKDTDFGLTTLTYSDALQFAGQAARLRYAVRLVNASGQKAAFSNFVLIEPAAKIASNPTSLSLEISQEAVVLKWTAPASNVDGSLPPNILGYNVYRSVSKTEPGKLLNAAPVSDTYFADEFFEFGKEYYYFVRAVSLGSAGAPTESGESNIVQVTPVDTFAPSAPAAITLAASPTSISIFFAVNPEKDISGYKIYRSDDPSLDKASWTLLTPELLKTNTFQDTRVEPGRTYYYYLTATDNVGNVSLPSDVVSESVQ